MQRWSKSQFQSKILERKLILIVITLTIISISPQVFAEDVIQSLVKEDNIVFEVGKDADVNVKQIIKSGAWSENNPKFLSILLGDHSNLMVTDEDGDQVSFSYKEISENEKYVQLNQKAAGLDLIVSYDLKEFMKKDDGIWKKHFLFVNIETMIYFDEDVNLIFANSRPINVEEARGINCIGCELTVEFFGDSAFVYTVESEKEDRKLYTDIISNEKISEIQFRKELNLLNFDVDSKNQLFVLKIPLELILNPYEIYFTGKDDAILDQADKIRKSEFYQDEDFVKISFRTTGKGTISVLGATMDEHQKTVEKLEKRKMAEIESSLIDEKKGVALPFPNSMTENKNILGENVNEKELSFGDDLVKKQDVKETNNVTIFVVIGIVVAIIIGFRFFSLLSLLSINSNIVIPL